MTNTLLARGGARALLDRILDLPELTLAVQSLPPEVLSQVITHVGLEECGELIALATPAQLARVLDEDVWANDTPGEDETFDADRFALWLSVLVEEGAAVAARKMLELDQDLVILALCRHAFVLDIEQLAQGFSDGEHSEVQQIEKQLESGLYHELEEYRIISRNHRSWDAVLTVLVELHAQHFSDFERLLSRCCHICNELIDEQGLYNVLTAAETVAEDAAAEREQRRERAGYVSPSTARSFIKLTESTTLQQILAATAHDPITHAHFRDAPVALGSGAPSLHVVSESASPAGLARLMATLNEAGVVGSGSEPKRLAGDLAPRAKSPLTRAMRELRAQDEALYEQRALELAYLANVLLSAGLDGQRLAPREAADTALALCDAGFCAWLESPGRGVSPPSNLCAASLREVDLVKLFRAGVRLRAEGKTTSARAHVVVPDVAS